MGYNKTTWVNGTTPLDATNMNKIETGIETLDAKVNPATATSGQVLTADGSGGSSWQDGGGGGATIYKHFLYCRFMDTTSTGRAMYITLYSSSSQAISNYTSLYTALGAQRVRHLFWESMFYYANFGENIIRGLALDLSTLSSQLSPTNFSITDVSVSGASIRDTVEQI